MVGEETMRRVAARVPLLFFALGTLVVGCDGQAQDIENHLEMGKQFLAAGQLADALSHYHAAVDLDPTNYMTYFKRATVYLGIGKSKAALPDLDKVLELRPNFHAARVQKGNILMKQGNLAEAKAEFDQVLLNDQTNAEAYEALSKLNPVEESYTLGKHLLNQGDYPGAIAQLSTVIDVSPWFVEAREHRSEAYMGIHEYFKAIMDIKSTTKLVGDNTAAYFRISHLYYELGNAEDSLSEIRECLKLDPEHKDCFPLYKKVKKLVKQTESARSLVDAQDWKGCLSKADQILQTEPRIHVYVTRARSRICQCTAKLGDLEETLKVCAEVLRLDPHDYNSLCDVGDTYIFNEMYEEAVGKFQEVLGMQQDYHRAKEGLEKAQKLLKQSRKKDYYKILGVSRNADKRTVIKAYRKLAMEWHPDKFSDEDEKKKAEKRFIDIASAKEVLTNPEMRQQFDNGEDPLDPEQQGQGGHQHPFFHGFNPFGSGGGGGGGGQGGSYKFHFG